LRVLVRGSVIIHANAHTLWSKISDPLERLSFIANEMIAYGVDNTFRIDNIEMGKYYLYGTGLLHKVMEENRSVFDIQELVCNYTISADPQWRHPSSISMSDMSDMPDFRDDNKMVVIDNKYHFGKSTNAEQRTVFYTPKHVRATGIPGYLTFTSRVYKKIREMVNAEVANGEPDLTESSVTLV